MLKIRWPLGRLIFNMGIAIPGKTVFLIETAPWPITTLITMCGWSPAISSTMITNGWWSYSLSAISYQLKIRGVLEKNFVGGVQLRFSVGYPWLRKIWSKTYPWLRTISWSWAHSYVIYPSKRNLAKTDENLVPRRWFLGFFVENIPLAKEVRRKIYPWLRNFCQKYTLG